MGKYLLTDMAIDHTGNISLENIWQSQVRVSTDPTEADSKCAQGNPVLFSKEPQLDISVVMPVRNEGPYIEAVIRDVLDQDLDGLSLEVVVVDGRSTDDTRERVQQMALHDNRIRLLDNPAQLASAARALGVQMARGRYIAIVDGHCRIPSRTLWKDMVDLFERTGAACLSRPQPLVSSTENAKAQAIAAARTSCFGHSMHSTIFDSTERPVSPTSSGAMYRREVFEQVGTFDPRFDACEDVEMNWRCARASLSCWTSPKLAIEYEPRRTFNALFHQMFRYGLGRYRLHRKHPESFSLESLIPTAFVLGIPLALLGFLLLPTPWKWLAVTPYLLYAGMTLFFSCIVASRKGWPLLPWLPLVFVILHTGLGVGYLSGLLTENSDIE